MLSWTQKFLNYTLSHFFHNSPIWQSFTITWTHHFFFTTQLVTWDSCKKGCVKECNSRIIVIFGFKATCKIFIKLTLNAFWDFSFFGANAYLRFRCEYVFSFSAQDTHHVLSNTPTPFAKPPKPKTRWRAQITTSWRASLGFGLLCPFGPVFCLVGCLN